MRALLSAYDKTGIEELASELVSLGCDLISSGGTATRIAAAGIPVVDVADITGFPAILGHRVVTLHPKVHGGILADPTDAEHRTDLDTYGIDTIDLVVANLYPFASDPSIELIDIGGPAMVRAAAKNHAHVGVVVDPDDYAAVLDEIRELGALGDGLRRRLARKAFAHTAAYDAQIVSWFDDADGVVLPETLHVSARRSEVLRYGENPHQMGARYSTSESWWDTAVRHQGKEMSYLNVFDAEAAWQLVHSLDTRPTAVVVKHANPCGAAVAPDISTAYRRAHEGDPVSAFGGIVALNEPMTLQVAESLVEVFTEVVIAPGFEAGALDVLAAKPNLRVLEATPPHDGGLQLRSIDGGLLVQNADSVSLDQTGWTVPTARPPSDAEWSDLLLAWKLVAKVSSNTIVLVKDGAAVGIGAGQQNRRDAGTVAAQKAAGRAQGGACASDAFFPFRDGLDAAAEAGATAVIQPGGSIRDEEVVAAADEAGMAMVFTGERHFRH